MYYFDFNIIFYIKQSQSTSAVKDVTTASSPTKDGDKKIDWHLWKTGQLKLEGQGLKQMPDEKDLPEEFQRKLGIEYDLYSFCSAIIIIIIIH